KDFFLFFLFNGGVKNQVDGIVYHEVGVPVKIGRRFIDDNEMISGKITDQPRGRVHDERRPRDNQRVRLAYAVDRARQRLRVKLFLIQNNVGTDNPAAVTAGNAGAVRDKP